MVVRRSHRLVECNLRPRNPDEILLAAVAPAMLAVEVSAMHRNPRPDVGAPERRDDTSGRGRPRSLH